MTIGSRRVPARTSIYWAGATLPGYRQVRPYLSAHRIRVVRVKLYKICFAGKVYIDFLSRTSGQR